MLYYIRSAMRKQSVELVMCDIGDMTIYRDTCIGDMI